MVESVLKFPCVIIVFERLVLCHPGLRDEGVASVHENALSVLLPISGSIASQASRGSFGPGASIKLSLKASRKVALVLKFPNDLGMMPSKTLS